MNTKQVLYNALSAQLDIKKAECEKYDKEIYALSFEDLSESIRIWLKENITDKFDIFEYTGDRIKLDIKGSSYWKELGFVIRGWNENKYVEFEWSSDNCRSNNEVAINKAILIGELASKFNIIEDKFKNEWHPNYMNMNISRSNVWKDYEDLKLALDNLRREIQTDAVSVMKQIGFEIKEFKPYYRLNWNYDNDNGRIYNIEINTHAISLQTGRAKYEQVYVNGFKILGKKGNKYQVEVYRRDGFARTYNILEKKMDSFINDVSDWQNIQADEYKVNVENQYKEKTNK